MNVRYPNIRKGGNYLDWMRIACVVSSTGCPSIVIPCGSSSDGRPIGVQIIAPRGGDATAIAAASFLESVLHLELSSVRALKACSLPKKYGTCPLDVVDGPRTVREAARLHGLKDWDSWNDDE